MVGWRPLIELLILGVGCSHLARDQQIHAWHYTAVTAS